MRTSIYSIILGALLSSCTHSVHQLYVSSMDKDANYGQGSWKTADTIHNVILGFSGDSSYVEKAKSELEAKCPGRISQITTEHLTSYRFFSYNQKLVLRGFCQK